jgi:glycosyltransferase involved in cell wall biosynthesis
MTQNNPTNPPGDAGRRSVASISVFFPCYNEQANIRRTARQAVEVLEKLNADYELIIVDDGKIADEIAADNKKVKIIHHPRNLGYGAALRSGFKAASRQLIFFTDGDGQFDINEMPALLPLIEQFDIVSCYRINRQDSLIRKINAWCWTKLVCFLFAMKLRDIDCAFKLFRAQVFDDMNLISTGALIDTEVLARAARNGWTITQRPVHHYPRTAGRQTGANIKVILRAFKELLELRRQMRKETKLT